MCVSIYIYKYNIWWLIKIPCSANGHSSRIKVLLSRNFRELHVYLSRRPMLGNNTSYEDSITTCQITPENHGSLLNSLFKHAASITESLLRTDCCWLVFFCKVYWPLQHAPWLSPAPSQNFRGTFAKIPLFTDPGHQQGAHWRKSEHQGPWRLALAKPHFWKLGCCIWSLFLETSEIIIRQWQRQVQGCASGPWCFAVAKPHLWKLVWLILMKGKVIVQKHHHTRN